MQKDGNSTLVFDLPDLSPRLLAAKGTYILDVDIDYLERINETLGRKAGDAAIADTAARIEKSVPAGTVFFRIGADEFVVLANIDDLNVVETIAKKVLRFAEEPVVWSGGMFHFSVSVGITKVPLDIDDGREALGAVHDAVIQAKLHQRNSYKVI